MNRLLLIVLTALISGCTSSHATSPGGVPSSGTTQSPGSWHGGGIDPATAGIDPAALIGEATWYGEVHHGRTTASGEPFDMYAMTAAHKTLPFDTVVRVIRDDTRQSVIVRINDRGPYGEGRVIDLSRVAAEEIDLIRPGHVPVTVEILSLPR